MRYLRGLMRSGTTYTKVLRVISAVCLLLLLTWLTASLPFVNNAKQQIEKDLVSKTDKPAPISQPDEKAPSNTSIQSVTEEYIHHNDFHLEVPVANISTAFIHAHESTYIAFHKELLCPPPNITLS